MDLKGQYKEEATITKKYFTFGRGCFGSERPIYRRTYNNEKYFALGGCTVLEIQIYTRTYNNEKYFALEGCSSIEMQIYTRIYNNKKYFALGECASVQMQIYTRIYNNKKYFHLGGCFGLERPIHIYEQREQPREYLWKNILFGEDVLDLKAQYTDKATII